MAAEKLYYKDVYQRKFHAKVVQCRPGKKGYEVALDQTVFYPEGGGQPYDTGTLGKAKVLEVHSKDGEVWHDTDCPLEVGSQVEGNIDWDRRFDLMQQHSGEHLVSGLIHEKYGYDNVGFHMGTDRITIDFNGIVPEEDLPKLEEKINEVIWENIQTRVLYPTEEELKQLCYRSKKELSGWVRLVEFPGTDLCACCGLHVTYTGEIGMVKLLSVQKFREGVRMEMISGKRVLDYLNEISEQNHQISVQLSAKPGETAAAVRRLAEENFRLRGRVMDMEAEAFEQEARRRLAAGDVLLFEKGMEADSVRRLATAVMETCQGRCAVYSDSGDGSFKYAIGEKGGDLRELVRQMNQALNGRGGGKPFFVQGNVKASRNEIEEFWRQRK